MVGKCRVEFQHLLQSVAFNNVEVAVGQSSHIGAGLSQSHLFPENVPKYVSLSCTRERAHNFSSMLVQQQDLIFQVKENSKRQKQACKNSFNNVFIYQLSMIIENLSTCNLTHSIKYYTQVYTKWTLCKVHLFKCLLMQISNQLIPWQKLSTFRHSKF